MVQVEMMGEGQITHQSAAAVLKGLVIPGYGGVSRIPPLHRNTMHIVGGITTHILKSSNFVNLYLKNTNKTHIRIDIRRKRIHA